MRKVLPKRWGLIILCVTLKCFLQIIWWYFFHLRKVAHSGIPCVQDTSTISLLYFSNFRNAFLWHFLDWYMYGDIELLPKVTDVFQETTLHLKQHMYKCLILCDAPQLFNLKCHYYNLKVFKVGDIHLVSNGGHSCSNIHLTFCTHQDICNLSAAGSCEVRLGKRSSYYAYKTTYWFC